MGKKTFIFVHVNTNSYGHKFIPLQEILQMRFADLLIVSELDDSFPNSQFNVEVYSIHRQDKSVSRAGLISHYNDVIMSTMASQITSLTIVYSTVYSGADQRKHQRSASLAFMREFTGASNAENVSKALYKINMARNTFRKFGTVYWKENRIHCNNVVWIRKTFH